MCISLKGNILAVTFSPKSSTQFVGSQISYTSNRDLFLVENCLFLIRISYFHFALEVGLPDQSYFTKVLKKSGKMYAQNLQAEGYLNSQS
jgi:hypothetical protein